MCFRPKKVFLVIEIYGDSRLQNERAKDINTCECETWICDTFASSENYFQLLKTRMLEESVE